MPRHSNESYLAGIRDHDPGLLRDFYRDFYPGIRNFVIRNSGTEEDAKDIFGDVAEVLLRKIQLDGFVLTCQLSTFLTEVGARLWLKKLRRKKFDAGVTTDDPVVLKYVADFTDPIETTERHALFRKYFRKLDEGCLKALQLGIMEGKSHEEVMAETGLTAAYSRKLRSMCVKKLMGMIRKDPAYKELTT